MRQDTSSSQPPDKQSQGKVKLALDNLIVLILGRRGQGKTTLMYSICKQHSRVFIFDARWQTPLDPSIDWKIAYTPTDLPPLLKQAHYPNSYHICYRSRHARDEFPFICKLFNPEYFPEFHHTLFCVDEILKVSDRYVLPEWWNDLVHFSRHGKIGLVLTTQRPTDLHADLQAEATDLFTLKQHHPRDIQRLAEICTPEQAAIASTLPLGKALWWHDGKVFFPVDNRSLKVG